MTKELYALQCILKGQGHYGGELDGIYGGETETALEAVLGFAFEPLKERAVHVSASFSKPRRHVDRVFVHCSASDAEAHDDVSVMREWHLKRGWNDVGYHFFVKKDGTLQTGRSVEQTPAAQSGHNTGTIAICLHGLEVSKFTETQFFTLRRLCEDINAAYGGSVTFHGHREVAAKDCPVFDYRAVLGLDNQGKMVATA